MVFDELTKQFVPRYGYKGANQGIEDHAIVEVRAGQDPYADPWAAAREEKKERIAKNEHKRQRNIERNEVGKGRGKKGKIVAYGTPPSPPWSRLLLIINRSGKCARNPFGDCCWRFE
jgi:hypothetical protein